MPGRQITAANQFTDAERFTSDLFDVSIYGSSSFVGTIVLQRRRVSDADVDANWRTVQSYSGAAEETGEAAGNWMWRIGCLTGGYTSGSIYVEVSQ